MRSVLAIALVLVLFEGCSDGKSSGGNASRNWTCSENDQCTCKALKPRVIGTSINGVDQCTGYSCCLLTEQVTESALATCECFDSTSCEAEASSRRGATIVSQCPPASESSAPAACAAAGENCRPSYLEQNQLSGCCQGTLCRTGADGVPLCQAASADEIALDAQCRKAARNFQPPDPEVAPPASVKTSVGELKLDHLPFTSADLGAGGCLTALMMTFKGGDSLCELELRAKVQNGRLAPSYVFGNLGNCEGYVSANAGSVVLEDKPASIPFEVTFQGLACESECVTGTFDWHLTGTVDGVTFDDQHLVASGTLCSALLDESVSCPSP